MQKDVMRSRTEIVNSLIEDKEDVSSLMKELRTFGWDSDELVTLTPSHIIDVLNKYLVGDIDGKYVRDWSNAIEQRDDIGMLVGHKETLDEMVFWLANPELNYEIEHELAKRIINNLKSNVIE